MRIISRFFIWESMIPLANLGTFKNLDALDTFQVHSIGISEGGSQASVLFTVAQVIPTHPLLPSSKQRSQVAY